MTPLQPQKLKKTMYNIKRPPKTSNTQRLQIDIGRSVGVTTVTHVVCWTLISLKKKDPRVRPLRNLTQE